MPDYECRCPSCHRKILELVDLQGGTAEAFLQTFKAAEVKCGRCRWAGSVQQLVIVGGED
jgi:hypothetical protein